MFIVSYECQILHVNASNPNSMTFRHLSTLETFLRQSVHHCFSNAEVLAQSFRSQSTDARVLSEESKLNVVDFRRLSNTISFLRYMTGTLVYDSLWQCLQSLYTPPSEIIFINTARTKSQPQTRPIASRKSEIYEDEFYSKYTRQKFSNSDGEPYISDLDSAHIIYICFCTLSITSICNVASDAVCYYKDHDFLPDHDRDESRRRLLHQLIKVIAARKCYWNIQRNILDNQSKELEVYRFPLASILSDCIKKVDNIENLVFRIPASPDPLREVHLPLSKYLVHCLMCELYDNWDGSDTIRRSGLVGGILELITGLYDL